jgi:DNA-binding NarL/FixJ family response regulator
MRILLVDDNRLLIEGLSNLLAAHGMEVTGIASNGLEAVSFVETLHPDLILMDIRMPKCNGLEATRRIKASHPDIKIVILTTSDEDQDLFESIKAGASGYLLKSISGDAFMDALRGMEQGIPPFSPNLAAKLLKEFSIMAEQAGTAGAKGGTDVPESLTVLLTQRQIEVLRLIAAGLTYKEVGQRLSLSERTVRYHMVEIMERLHLEHRSQVIAYAGKQGLISPE